MTQNEQKRAAAEAALSYVDDGMVLGIGSGSTVACFIEALSDSGKQIEGAVSSSSQSSALMKKHGIAELDLNAAGPLHLCVDGADECDPHKRLIKGGGAALTREKIVAAASKSFVCIIDPSKLVEVLGAFPLPIEVIPMARSHVAREIVRLDGRPVWRDDCVTDNGNWILDVHGWRIDDPVTLENELNQLVGVVSVGLFARRGADIVFSGDTRLD
ncbi:MAG: ribose-5-phosphate isomerase RpiA [Rhodanobacteraceae bacterium]